MKKGRLWSAGAVTSKGAVATAVSLPVFFSKVAVATALKGFFSW